ncbi:MAG: sulfatase [Phycisphaerae bacterium]|nr:sulfatase [Phycisphaerae bacterium]
MNACETTRRDFLKAVGLGTLGAAWTGPGAASVRAAQSHRPNILFCIADDWSWPHASIAGDRVVKTPTFDAVAREGVLFSNAFVTAPSCTPSRGSIVTGQWHWRLEEGGNLWSTLPAKFPVYPDLLERAGYYVGCTRKGWGPGQHQPGGRARNPAGPSFKDFKTFLQARPNGTPFCFWFGSHDPHRDYDWESGVKSGMKPEDVAVPPYLPDNEIVRKDLCDYYFEVQRFDREVGELLDLLREAGELDRTLVVITGDNGLPFPRCKSNLYDGGTRVPLAMRWPARAQGGRVVQDFVSLQDLAPTFLEAAGLTPPAAMTGRSLLAALASDGSGWIDPARDHVLTGKERHAWVRKGGLGYPCRAIRTRDFLYIRNFEPQRWPAGDPTDGGEPYYPNRAYGDIDDSPTKTYMMKHRDDAQVKPLFEPAFEKRPAEELYDLHKDPYQLRNVASDPAYADTRKKLESSLLAELRATGDPRVLGGARFDDYPYYGGQQPKTR